MMRCTSELFGACVEAVLELCTDRFSCRAVVFQDHPVNFDLGKSEGLRKGPKFQIEPKRLAGEFQVGTRCKQ